MSRSWIKIMGWKILLALWFESFNSHYSDSVHRQLSLPMFGPYQVASALEDLTATNVATVLVAGKYTQSLYILKE